MRPKKLESQTYKMQIACGKIYVTVSHKDGKPWEVFINSGGGCKANHEAIGRLISALLRNGLQEEAHKQLMVPICVACERKKGEFPAAERKNYPKSCADAIARVLNGEEE